MADLKLKETVSISESTSASGKLQIILEDPNDRKENGAIDEASLELPAEEIQFSDAIVLRKGIPAIPSHIHSSLFSTGSSVRK